jgi:dipeptidyl aminopeptidase/acylaminoacyl peptidase
LQLTWDNKLNNQDEALMGRKHTQMADKQVKPFGFWPSPITPELLGAGLSLEDVAWDSDGNGLVWLEGRSDQNVLVSCTGTDAIRDLTDVQSPRGGVGYGGGAFSISHGTLVFANSDGRLFRRGAGYDRPVPITPAYGATASPVISPDGHWVAYVHSVDRKDSIALADIKGHDWPVKLVQGSDFYMQPVWHPDSARLAWIEWNHPNMPWDGTRLMLGRLAGNPPHLTVVESIAGDEDVPVFQPAFSPDGAWLSYLTNQGEWDQLVVMNLASGERRVLVADAVLMDPAWVQGLHMYGWSPTSQRLYYLRNDAGVGSVWSVDLASGQSQKLDFGPYVSFDQLAVSPTAERLVVVASGTTIPTRLVTWQDGRIDVVRYASSETIAPEDLPEPRDMTWPAADGTLVHAIYFPPTSSQFTGEGLPPAMICIHGGPTSQNVAAYSGEAAYFTSRGYAFVYVNYRGSTGYGRSYMLALRRRWGDLDVEDAAGCAQALVDQGLADPHRLVIRGGSAGGYTVYNALIRYPGRFKAGLCSFGVSNLFSLALDTHKFEERYTDSMVGPLPEASALYHEWSPIFHADRLTDPIAIFQGSADKVVPPDQSESIVAVLRERKVPHFYRLFEGEGHGFRKRENIITYYADIERFLKTYVLFG